MCLINKSDQNINDRLLNFKQSHDYVKFTIENNHNINDPCIV